MMAAVALVRNLASKTAAGFKETRTLTAALEEDDLTENLFGSSVIIRLND